MSIPTVYIKGTKRQTNERLAKGERVTGVKYDMFSETPVILDHQPDGTVIKFWEKMSSGNPIAKSYGNWRPAKNKIV
jgi:hypothetical protein